MARRERSPIPIPNNETQQNHEQGEESFIPLSEVFDIVYPGLDPAIFELTQNILAAELERLSDKGIQATWVRSGARRLAVHLAQSLENIDELRSKWGFFRPELMDKPETARRYLASVGKQIMHSPRNVYDSQTESVVKKYTELPDMDIKIGAVGALAFNTADTELDYFLEKSVEPSLDNAVTNGPPEKKDNRVQISALYAEKGLLLEADVGKIRSANKRNAAFRFKNGEDDELFGVQIGTNPETVYGALVDNRNSTTSYSNEEITFPLTVKDGHVMINISGFKPWVKNLDKKIGLSRSTTVEVTREAVLALRSARIACHMFPSSEHLPEIVDSLYDQNALEYMKSMFAYLTKTVKLDPVLESTLYREFVSMIEADPYFAAVWAVETGAAKFFLGEKGDGILINSLLSERMTCQTEPNHLNNTEQKPLPTFLRSPKNLHKDRDIFLSQGSSAESGLRIFYDSLNLQFRAGALQASELDGLIKLFSDSDNQHMHTAKISGELDTEYHSSILLQSLRSLLKYAEGAFPKDLQKNEVLINEYARVFNAVMNTILENTAKQPFFTTEEVQVELDDLIERSKLKHYRNEMKAYNPLAMLVRVGVITRWKNNYILTPRRDLQALVLPYWKAMQEDPDYLHYRQSAVHLLFQILSEDILTVKKYDKGSRWSKAEQYVDRIAPRLYLNIFGLLRSPPTAQSITYRTRNSQQQKK